VANGTTTMLAFTSDRRIGMIRPDGSEERYLDFSIAGQASWQFGPRFRDGSRIIVHSFEDEKTWQGNVQSHVWVYDFVSGALTEIATEGRLAPFTVCAALLEDEGRMVINPLIDGEQRVFTANLDGSAPHALTQPGEGFAYGISLSPDGGKLAFHITPYQIWTMDLDGSRRSVVAADAGHLYFGPVWSPDGEWLAYLDCIPAADPGHDWAALCIGRPDGSEHRVVTEMNHWFGTSYGSPRTRGGGSNTTQWSPDCKWLTYTRALPGSRTAWQFQPQRPDTDHFNRDYLPEQARGGTELCLLDPFAGELRQLTVCDPLRWDFRAGWSPDGEQIVFSRAVVGEPSELWVMDADGANQRFLSRGCNEMGADFGRWIQVPSR